MSKDDVLKDKVILVVDDEPDVLEIVEEVLDTSIVHKSTDFKTGLEYLMSYTYDIVILDIMGVNGFELLRNSADMGFPTVMLTAHALTPEAMKKSIGLGAVSFLPKDKLPELRSFLEDVVLGGKKQVWQKLFEKLGTFFSERFGPDWKERDRFFREFEEELKESAQ
jgi:DNA-binding NtrC family response regulator